MTVTPETLRALERVRAMVDVHVDGATAEMTLAWSRMWTTLEQDWAYATQEIIAAQTTGHLTRTQLFRLTRVRHALDVSLYALVQLAGDAKTSINTRVPVLVSDATEHERSLIASQVPDMVDINRRVKGEITAITRRTTHQVTSLTSPLARDAYEVMLGEVQRGVALGVNPRATAARMLQRTRGGFDGGLARATRIARTEMLDAQRAGAAAMDDAHSDVVTGWRWSAALSPRTCPACLSMNGREFPRSTPGPQGHVNCRCARVPSTKSWAELGFVGMDEGPDVLPNARDWFDGLSRAEQLKIMGPTRLNLLQAGWVSWDDLAVVVPNPGWRPSYQPRSLMDLRSPSRWRRTG